MRADSILFYNPAKLRTRCNANSIDPDQTTHFAASNLGLHCLPSLFAHMKYGDLGIQG